MRVMAVPSTTDGAADVGPLEQRDLPLAAAVPAGQEAADHAAVGDQAAPVDHEHLADAVEVGELVMT